MSSRFPEENHFPQRGLFEDTVNTASRAATSQIVTERLNRGVDLRQMLLFESTPPVDLEIFLNQLRTVNALNPEGRHQLNLIRGDIGRILGDTHDLEIAQEIRRQVKNAMARNTTLKGTVQVNSEDSIILDAEKTPPDVITAVRILLRSLKIEFSETGVHITNDENGLSTLEIENDPPVVAKVSFPIRAHHLSQNARRVTVPEGRTSIYFTKAETNLLLADAHRSQKPFLVIGDPDHKLIREVLMIPQAEDLFAQGAEHFESVINTILDLVFNQHSGIPHKDSFTVRLISVSIPDLSGIDVQFAIRLKKIGQHLVLDLDERVKAMIDKSTTQ